jgi:hypothetical protein
MSKPDRTNRTTRPPVSMNDAERAVEALRLKGRVDMDAYLERIDVRSVMQSPLGPTADCLTLEQLEEYVSGTGDRPEAAHLAGCEDCTAALNAYLAVRERPLEVVARKPIEISVDVDDLIELALEEVKFDVMLQAQAAFEMSPAQLTIDNGVFGQARCKAIQIVDSPVGGGYTYRATCVAKPSKKLFASLEAGTEIVDWVKIGGVTKTGEQFSATDLVRFTVPRVLKLSE